ncbi:neuropeptide FF receptor 2-like [Dreissena polymorpha]|uniref:G-protein coupled receptors family 1 profile domain-containing protein n=1 Tax=Dreissena polymorpha TaxID=45954 RepID=A0A9D4FMI7_DREPO|nr:neuropeptide FF receptor 2-like [Dreissena polymorpha]KAH3799185.1 hypothetical protein DPMN_152791 [Dreissena polymorpha]
MTTEANISDSDLLDKLNSEVASLMTPVVVYLSVLMLFGLLGNILVCYYYGQQTRRSSHSVFICTVALFDLVSCAVSMPIEIVDIRFYYTFTNGHLCKFLRFVNHVAAIGSAFTLLAISVDRFRRICRPLKKQLDLLKCKLLCALSFLLGLIYSWPALVFYKSVEVDLNAQNGRIVKGYDCTTTDESNYRAYIWGFNFVYLITFIFGTGTLVVMYSLVGRSIYQHNRKLIQTRPMSRIRRSKHVHADLDSTKIDEESSGIVIDEQGRASCARKANAMQLRAKCIDAEQKKAVDINGDHHKKDKLNNKSIKYTMIMLVVASIFVISFLPYLILVIVDEFNDLRDSLRGSSLVGYEIGVRSYFLNSAINPMVYGFLNPKFRQFYSCKLARLTIYSFTSEALSSSTAITNA